MEETFKSFRELLVLNYELQKCSTIVTVLSFQGEQEGAGVESELGASFLPDQLGSNQISEIPSG